MTTNHVKLLICLAVMLIGIPAVAWQENGYLVDSIVELAEQPLESISDGQGGMIVTFTDLRVEGVSHIYAQRFNADGFRVWPEGGVPICTYAIGNQEHPAICSDNNGGAFIVWSDVTNGGIENIYGQHINSAGSPSLVIDGTKMNSISAETMHNPSITSGNDGTAYVAWNEGNGNNRSLEIMRLASTGRMWTTQKEISSIDQGLLSNFAMDYTSLGATVTWTEYDIIAGTQYLYYRTVQPDGSFAQNQVRIYYDSYSQLNPQIEADPLGGFYICWHRALTSLQDILITHVEAGNTGMGNSSFVCNHSSIQDTPKLTVVEDGVIVAWRDFRSSDSHIYAQKLTPNLTTLWTYNGHLVCSTSSDKTPKHLIPDGAGGALVVWEDFRNSNTGGIFLQRISGMGYTTWNSAGVPATTLGNNQDPSSVISDGNGGLIAAWRDILNSTAGLMVQRVERNGYWGYPAASIASVEDIPGDEGGKVNLAWESSRLDNWVDADIENYSLWRALPDAKVGHVSDNWLELIGKEKSGSSIVREEVNAITTIYWEYIESVAAFSLPAYSRVVSTNSDHTETNSGLHFFQVMAHGNSAGEFWISDSAQGWSVDNLAPALVAGLDGSEANPPGGFDLHWHANTETDLHHYEVHRGLSAEFIPSPSSLVAAPSDTTYLDVDWNNSGWFYKVAAVDNHDNLGDFATLAPDEVSGVDASQVPVNTTLKGNYPNPFNPSTTISYELAVSGPVRLDIYEASGRLVRTLVNDEQMAGRQNVYWNGRDMNQRNLASGVYFYRLQADGQVQSRRMTLVK